MTNRIALERSTFLILYYRYKGLLIPVLTILGCIIVVYLIVIPQFQDMLGLKNQLDTIDAKNVSLQNNITKLSTVNENDLDKKLQIMSSALPSEKDFSGVLYAISSAAENAHVALGDFSFSVGDLSTQSAQLNSQLSLQMLLTVKGDIYSAKEFIKELSQKLPLSEVTTLTTSGDSTSIATSFFYRPFPPINFLPNSKIIDLPSGAEEQVQKLSDWQTAQDTALKSNSVSQNATLSGK